MYTVYKLKSSQKLNPFQQFYQVPAAATLKQFCPLRFFEVVVIINPQADRKEEIMEKNRFCCSIIEAIPP
jgi:hypothetical protein